MPLPRESVYPFGATSASTYVPSPDFLNHLQDCIDHTEAAVSTLDGAVQKYQPGIADMPRLAKVLHNEHRFLVLPSTQIQAHQAQVSASIAPQIEALISKAEALVSSQAAKVANLEERLAIMQSRHQPAPSADTIPQASASVGSAIGQGASATPDGQAGSNEIEASYIEELAVKDLTMPQRRKLVMLKSKRARLEKEWQAHLAEEA